jgi:hypothetical protein
LRAVQARQENEHRKAIMFAMNSDTPRTVEAMRAAAEPRTFSRRIDCCEGLARGVEARPSRGGGPRPSEAWEHTRRSRT